MNSLRRPPPDPLDLDDVVLAGVVAVPSPGAAGGGAGPSDQGAPTAAATTEYELWATEHGLVIAAVTGACRPVPDLVPWSLVCSVTVEGVIARADGSRGELLEICLSDGGWSVGDRVQRFVAPTAGLGGFLLAATAHRQLTTASEPNQFDEDPAPRSGVTAAVAAVLASLKARWTGDASGEGSEPQHGLGRRRIGPVAVGMIALLLLAGSGTIVSSVGASAPPSASVSASGSQTNDVGNGFQARGHRTANLAAATSKPRPAPPSLAGSPPLQSHEIFGYAPYWTLPQSSGYDVKDLTTLAYFSVDANPNGTLDESGSGWNGYESQDLVKLVNRSHAAGDRVVLTVTDFSQSSLDAITSDPGAPARLSAALIAAVSAKNLDGVNFDFEGEGSEDQVGLTHLITQVSHALHSANPHWQVTMATYASSAGDPGGFYNIAALAPAVDGFFIMAYDVNNQFSPSATSPEAPGGFSDTEALKQYTAVAPASKVILGLPFYGYDWPTNNGTITAKATGSGTPLSDGVIAASGHPTYWDATTQTAWTSYKVGNQWHETFFDNPTSLALEARLANSYHVAGVGIWALGMDGNNPSMMAALLGNAPAAKDYQSGPTNPTAASSPTTTVPPGTGYVTIGVWKGGAVSLGPVAPPASVGSAQYLGTLSRFTTNDPSLACLQSGPPLGVWSYNSLPGVDVVVAAQPQDCAGALFTFRPGKAKGSGTGTTTTTTSTISTTSTTSTTTPPTTTSTTSTTVPPTTTTTTTSTTTTTLPPTTTTTATTAAVASG